MMKLTISGRPARAAALCAVVYGFLYIRCGLLAAIVAHILTNLLLALFVIHFNLWTFW